MQIREAVPEEAAAACEVMRRSIAELCILDHHNDAATLQQWLSNKTPEIFRSWIRPGNSVMVAADGDKRLADGCVTDVGEITLNYVHPDARFSGVSNALLTVLEERVISHGNRVCTLVSTETARRSSYLEKGYAEDGPAEGKFGAASGYPMSKPLTSKNS